MVEIWRGEETCAPGNGPIGLEGIKRNNIKKGAAGANANKYNLKFSKPQTG